VTDRAPLDRRPHLLHLTIDKHGWLSWSLDCPYSATEIEDVPGRPCNLLEPNIAPAPDLDNHDPWIPIPGCFVKQYLEESGEWDDILQLDQTDPSFPVEVDVDVEGCWDDAYISALVPWGQP